MYCVYMYDVYDTTDCMYAPIYFGVPVGNTLMKRKEDT